jgi:EPS-associated MarR family transcriptional regulator
MNIQKPTARIALQADQASDGVRLAVLRLLQENPSTTQRELSKVLGLSLGKTHYLLHALLDKGLVKVQNFKRSDSKLAYAYLLTPSGIRHRSALTRSFLKQKEAEFEALQRTLVQLREELGSDSAER